MIHVDTSLMNFVSEIARVMQTQGRLSSWTAQGLATALCHVADNPLGPPTTTRTLILPEQLEEVDDVTLIFEMLRRGFAVMKVAERAAEDA